MPTLTLQRSYDRAGILRRIEIEVDGDVIARLKWGQRKVIEVATGRHVLCARMDWVVSDPLELTLGQDDSIDLQTSLRGKRRFLSNLLTDPSDVSEVRLVRIP